MTRGCAVATVALVLSWTAHVGGGGSAAPDPWLLVVGALVVCAAVLASARSWTVARLVVALGLTQLAVHGSLWLASSATSAHPRLLGIAAPGPVHEHAAGSGSVMLGAHVLAVVVSALVLARVDSSVAALWAVAHAVLGRTRARDRRAVAAPRLAAVSTAVTWVVAHDVATSRSRRGPPAVLAPC